MQPIANVDRLVLLLRQRLQERARTASSGKERARSSAGKPVDSIQELAAVEGLEDRQLRRALIQSVLADQFGRNLVNEARFQEMVDRVVQAMSEDHAASNLMDGLVAELRASTS